MRCMKARSKQHNNRWNATVLEQNISPICFPPFQSDKSNSEKGPSREGRTNENSYTYMENTTLVSSSVRDVSAMPSTVDPQGNKHPLVQNRKLTLVAWKVTGNPLRWMEFQARQPSLYPSKEDRVLLQVTNRPGLSRLAGVLGKI